jgi:hypothetical protein
VMPIQAKRCVAKAASGTCDDVERDLVGGRPTPGVPVHRGHSLRGISDVDGAGSCATTSVGVMWTGVFPRRGAVTSGS